MIPLDAISRDQAAAAVGYLAFFLVAVWPLLRSRRALLAGQAGSAAGFAVHYLLIGAYTGAALTALTLVQAAIAWPERRFAVHRAAYISTAVASAGLMVATWQGPASAFAAAGSLFALLGRWQTTSSGFRLAFFASGFGWIGHDIITLSIPGLLADTVCMCTIIVGWVRDRRRPAALAPVAC